MIVALQTLVFFRESLFSALDRLLRPYYKQLTLSFSRDIEDEDCEEEEQVFAEFDDEKGVVFFPPVYSQRYAAVSDCLMDERWCGQLEKVVDLGYHDMSFIKYLKEVPGVKHILGVDIESIPLRCSSDLLGGDDYAPKRESPLQVTLFEGNAADPDFRLIGCDAVVGIEMIEHMLPHDLDRLVHTVFGFIKPWIVIFTTPNADFNVLFKALEKNGLRRWDHFFEWSREQFHDWCSNIVIRYPQYAVSCKGIGPGPSGTIHHGCCSQLALFVNKDYHKQHDLDINSLALLAHVPSQHKISDMMVGWESPVTDNIICQQNNVESISEFLYSPDKNSCVTIVITSEYCNETLEYHDKTSQCNLETEIAKNFLMFDDEEMCFSVVVPRRKLDGKVYEIEDVNCRLNCTTCQVKKFSKTTQNMMAKNKIDSLVHTREVVDEIRHLTKMLNFNKRYLHQGGDGKHIWYNINWGENAPYWNQYYKIVRDYNYPFEEKSDECRILDLISEEINRLIDLQYDEEFSVDVNKLEIPIEHLMRVVSHITDNAEKVKDLLEWNGYEIINNVVIHSRLVVDNTSIDSHEEDWLENESIQSDCDTMDVHSTSLSDGSTIVQDYHGRCLRRALDRKVRALRIMLSADDDITTELDHVVCRLMKLALKSSRGKQTPPPARWMQCKLLDLLTLTEKSISRRKRHFIENFPLKAIGFGNDESLESIGLSKLKTDDTEANKFLEKYENLIQLSDTPNFLEVEECVMGEGEFTDIPNFFEAQECLIDEGELTEFNFTETGFSAEPEHGYVNYARGKVYKPVKVVNGDESSDVTVTWVEEDYLALVPYPDNKSAVISSSDHSTSFGARYRYKKPYKTFNNYAKNVYGSNNEPRKRSRSKVFGVQNAKDDKNGSESKTNLPKKVRKRNALDYGKYGLKSKRKVKERKKLQPTASNPIPGSLIELCQPELTTESVEFNFAMKKGKSHNVANESKCNIAATKESFLVSIVMEDMEETIALRRSIGTDADMDPMVCDQEVLMESALNVETNDSLNNMHHIATENVHSQTIFLYDINEPSTSKGVRHLSTDVQCGPDTLTPCFATVTPAHSVPRIPMLFSTGFKMRDSLTNLATAENTSDFGTSTNNIENFGPTSARLKFSNLFKSGIKIKDSSENLTAEKKSVDFVSTATNDTSVSTFISGIKIGVSSTDFTLKTCSGTCTDHDNKMIPKMKFDERKNKTEFCTFTDQEHHIIIPSMVESTKIKRQNYTKHSLGNVATKSSNEKYKTISPTTVKPIGINLNDSDTNLSKKVECGTPTRLDVMSDIKTPYDSTNETKLLKPISSGIIEDSCSEFYGSGFSASSPVLGTNSTKNTSLIRQSKLTYGGVHIHSYKEKQVSEDVVFQGKWLRNKAKAHTRKKPYNPVTVRRVTDPTVKKIKATNSTHTISVTEAQMKSEVEIKPVRKPRPVKPKPEPVKKEQIYKVVLPKTVVNSIRSNRNVTKVASKIAMSGMLSKNTKCTRFAKKSPVVPLVVPEVKKDVNERNKLLHKNYLPLYLKKRKPILDKNSLNQSLDSVQIAKELQKPKSKEMLPLTVSDPEKIKNSLIQFCDEPQENVSYFVFRNEIENQNRSATDCHTTDNNARKKNCTSRRSSSPASQNSSTCSTPDSIATVRAVTTRSKASTRRHSASSNKSSLGNTEPETTTPVRNRKFTKRGKNTKKSDEKDHDKENKPESSQKSFFNRDPIKIEKSAFKGRNKNVYMARVTNDASPSHNNDKLKQNQTPNKSCIRIPTVDSKDDVEKKKRPMTATLTHKTSIIKSSNSNCVVSEEKQSHENINPNKLQPVESYDEHINVKENTSQIHQNTSQITQNTSQIQENTPQITTNNSTLDSKASYINVVDDKILSQWLDSSSQSLVVSSAESSILAAMKHIVEERLDFIEPLSPKYYDLSNSDTLNLAIEEFNNQNMEDTLSSVSSFKTAMTHKNDFNNTLQSDNEEYNITFNTTLEDDSLQSLLDITPPTTDLELLSFKSLTSVSRYSEVFLVDGQPSQPTQAPPAKTSFKEIFERKEQQTIQPNPPGSLAIQAFSGFSMNAAPVAGDQPDYVNLVDSETGSVAAEFARQVTSEEVFVSGRSSSYGSCVIDEDADIVVPNWLFEMINQQHFAEEEEPLQQQLLLPMPMPALLPHEQFDMNGNVTDGLGAAAGAGDGRGMHSDHSQDSSGRGTSLSSSDASSGQQSDAILIDPLSFPAQFELMHEPIGASIAVTTLVVPSDMQASSFRTGEGLNLQNEMGTSRNAARNNPLLAASDVDADVSSLDTDDVPDSSDN